MIFSKTHAAQSKAARRRAEAEATAHLGTPTTPQLAQATPQPLQATPVYTQGSPFGNGA